MVALAPPLKAILEIKLKIENGSSVTAAIRGFTQNHMDMDFAKNLSHWFFQKESGQMACLKEFKTPIRQLLLEVLEAGMQGEPILERLQILEEEIREVANEDLDKHLQKLPFVSLIPLMLFQFPAFVMLLMGPLFGDLLSIFSHTKGL